MRWQVFAKADFGNRVVPHVAKVIADCCVVVPNHLQI
jgi:hypothetical protein